MTPRGTVLFMHGLGGREYTQPIVKTLVSRGWLVIDNTRSSIRTVDEDPPENAVGGRDQSSLGDRLAKASPEAKREWLIAAGEGIAEASEVLGDIAHAYDAVHQFVLDQRPELVDRPLVYVGCSMGAVCGPTIAARLERQPDAMVLIGGGANLLGISGESEMSLVQLTVKRHDGTDVPFNREDLDVMSEIYLRHATLDPYHTALRVAGTPVLVLHGRSDKIVPARYGDLLWERLGRPERWSWSYGHELLFFLLPRHADRIAEWVEHATR